MCLRLLCNPKSKINISSDKIYKIVFLNLSEDRKSVV